MSDSDDSDISDDEVRLTIVELWVLVTYAVMVRTKKVELCVFSNSW